KLNKTNLAYNFHMKITGFENNSAILKEFGQRIADQRLAMGLSQEDLAKHAGISSKTIARLEAGNSVSFSHIISILRSLKMLANIELLIPEFQMLPTEIYDGIKKRKRAPRNRSSQSKATWKWGDEQ
ncbi:MAG: helix-turn-helix domain-containing protein, partial [Enterococcus sp.]|nr:helix-turn-helix domain-containing protein [Enterococcus sp.]